MKPVVSKRLNIQCEKLERFTAMQADPIKVAKRLLGQRLVRVLDGVRLAGIIVEVEAYLGAADRAAHTYGGRRTPRNESMYLPGGHAYVYFTYGAHFCLNVVCGVQDEGVAVLIRALEPTEGIQFMFKNRPKARRTEDLCSGPGKLAQALQIDRRLDGIDLTKNRELFIERIRHRSLRQDACETSQRVGLNPTSSWEGDWHTRHLRYFLRNNPNVSH